MFLRSEGTAINEIADKVGLNRCSVILCLKKFKEGGIENALFDAPGRDRNAEITDDEKAWIINIACQKPTDFGYAAETWTYAKLTSHINKTAESAGYTRLSAEHKSTAHSILDAAKIKPFHIKYYCEKRDPDFDEKMHNVLLVYKQLSFQFDEDGNLLLDDKYPKGDKIRLVLDNLKVHTSEETRKYLATVPGRFEFVFTPKHGS